MTGDRSSPPEPDRRAALADANRRAVRATRVTTVDDDTLARATALLHEAAELLEASTHPGPHCQVGFALDESPFLDHRPPREFFPYSPVIGQLNPLSPPVHFEIGPDGDNGYPVVHGRVTLTEPYNGPPWNLVHGGIIAAIFDELLGVATIVGAGGGFTGRLTVHYRKPTPILEQLELTGWIDRVEGRKLIARGTLGHDGVVTAEAEGLFIQVGGPLQSHTDAPDGEPADPDERVSGQPAD